MATSHINKYKAYENKGRTGLANLGNTCFMNSMLQCLSHTYEFNNLLNTKSYQSKLRKIADSLILMEWDKLRLMMWSENCIISPGGFLDAVQKVAKIKDKQINSFLNSRYTIPVYSRDILFKETCLFTKWYLPKITPKKQNSS